MKPPIDLNHALWQIDIFLAAIMRDIDQYQESPADYQPEYFRDISAAAADARLLATWVRDQLKAQKETEC